MIGDTVWLAEEWFAYQSETVLGVFASAESARAHCESVSSDQLVWVDDVATTDSFHGFTVYSKEVQP